jgi:3-phenylpropionate/cinnamic acid dioxygenase small subunit
MTLLRSEAEDFLFHEARLLDTRQYDEWLKLFTDDGVYWLPMVDGSDPGLEPSVLFDDPKMRAMRVHQLIRKRNHYAQVPASRTLHSVSNVTIAPGSRDGEFTVRCNLMLVELREGNYSQLGLGDQRLFCGHCEYLLRRRSDLAAIAMKKVVLINRDVPIVNLSFII